MKIQHYLGLCAVLGTIYSAAGEASQSFGPDEQGPEPRSVSIALQNLIEQRTLVITSRTAWYQTIIDFFGEYSDRTPNTEDLFFAKSMVASFKCWQDYMAFIDCLGTAELTFKLIKENGGQRTLVDLLNLRSREAIIFELEEQIELQGVRLLENIYKVETEVYENRFKGKLKAWKGQDARLEPITAETVLHKMEKNGLTDAVLRMLSALSQDNEGDCDDLRLLDYDYLDNNELVENTLYNIGRIFFIHLNSREYEKAKPLASLIQQELWMSDLEEVLSRHSEVVRGVLEQKAQDRYNALSIVPEEVDSIFSDTSDVGVSEAQPAMNDNNAKVDALQGASINSEPLVKILNEDVRTTNETTGKGSIAAEVISKKFYDSSPSLWPL